MKSGIGRLIAAHRELLSAEVGRAVNEVKIIAALIGVAVVLALLALILVYVGTFLFLGEWLFGSMGWGILHGFLLTIAFVVPIGLNLAGGSVGAWGRAFVLSVVIAVVLGLIFAWNVLRNAAVWLGQQLQPGIGIEIGFLTWLSAAVVGALILGALLLIVGLVTHRAAVILLVVGLVLGFLGGALFGYITFDTQGAAAIAVTIGLILWIALSAVLALRAGIDPKARYDKLVPRESMAQLSATRAYLEQQWQRQRKKLVGR
ncbi:MAG: hypothetical protein QOH61_2159 [Chloroflexota bacterium]|nr:hypothetical protein [Chloroflexota bacterium]